MLLGLWHSFALEGFGSCWLLGMMLHGIDGFMLVHDVKTFTHLFHCISFLFP